MMRKKKIQKGLDRERWYLLRTISPWRASRASFFFFLASQLAHTHSFFHVFFCSQRRQTGHEYTKFGSIAGLKSGSFTKAKRGV